MLLQRIIRKAGLNDKNHMFKAESRGVEGLKSQREWKLLEVNWDLKLSLKFLPVLNEG